MDGCCIQLTENLEEFRGANSLQWGRVLDDTWDEVRENLEGHVLTNFKDLTDIKQLILQQVRHWLYNHSGNKQPGNKVAGHGKYLSLNQVLNLVKKKEVEKRMWDLYRVKPGQSGYIGKGEEWYINEPSEEVRQKVAKMKGRKVVKDFQMQATRDLGMLSFVLTAHRDTNGTICVSFHEQNDKAGFELFSKVQPNWKNVKIWEAWEKYAQSQFSDIDGSVPKESLPSKQKEKIKLPLDDNGYPILVDEDLSSPATFSDLQAIIRSLLMTHYQISTGNAKASVPWTSLAERPGNYIDLSKGYIPPGYRFREP
ncbi:hypothetical protein SERLA73DRAFT_149080 [Serpula lacrymans var. lacrymans S7.3]|uniref:Uncharacterized protein n=1 Tax=Serpula lacrymans var. lacrymans (strain S7.3) TaxID=936435 RepID=F8PEZ0_SERL3|nr:hypothetical protein SERLA73DRAFT_149080 [Serpula lacrymans var. lacrymans S7.3]